MPTPRCATARLYGACTAEAAADLRGVKSRGHLRLAVRFGGNQRQGGVLASETALRRCGASEVESIAALGGASCWLRNVVESSGAR